MTKPAAYCCDRMAFEFEQTCADHPDRWDCADALIGYWPKSRRYGLIVHDGGSSMVVIRFCPWCGADLPRFAKRNANPS
jgi:ribosomal protein S27AE